jgi:hypothetical protein
MASVARSSSILAEGSGAFLRAVTEMPLRIVVEEVDDDVRLRP